MVVGWNNKTTRISLKTIWNLSLPASVNLSHICSMHFFTCGQSKMCLSAAVSVIFRTETPFIDKHCVYCNNPEINPAERKYFKIFLPCGATKMREGTQCACAKGSESSSFNTRSDWLIRPRDVIFINKPMCFCQIWPFQRKIKFRTSTHHMIWNKYLLQLVSLFNKSL